MSDNKPSQSTEDFMAEINKKADLATLKEETAEKKALLDSKIVSTRLDQMQQAERDIEIAKNASYGALSKEELDTIVRDNDDYMEAAKNPMEFICDSFNDKVPFFRKNLILLGAKTGEGKSTAVANLAFAAVAGRDKRTGRTLRVLVITNEEKREDFYNRITSLAKGWHYTNHSKFTDEQRKEFSRMIPILGSSGRLTVIDNNHGGSHGVTTTIEGIESMFASLIEHKEKYDVVLLDYYQNIISSKLNPGLDQYKVQERVSRALDNFKNNYPAPIVVMAQLKSQSEKNQEPFQIRLMGSKSIMVPATVAFEMIVDRENLRTKWVCHKSRYTESVGKDFWTGYEKGRFVTYTNEFIEKTQAQIMEKEYKRISGAMDKASALPGVKPGGDDGTKV